MLERIQSQRYFVNHTTDARLAPFGQDYTLIDAANLLGMSKSGLHKRLNGSRILTDEMTDPPKSRNIDQDQIVKFIAESSEYDMHVKRRDENGK